MDTIWTWGWCLLPLAFFAIMALACFARAGRCACGHGGARSGDGHSCGSVPK